MTATFESQLTNRPMTNYERVEQAILYLRQHAREQPTLEQVADHVSLSPFHFQRLFSDWAGVSPKKFLQFLSLNHAKTLLRHHRLSVSETAWQTGLSGPSRLHDLFVNIEAMTPAEYRDGGRALTIRHSTYDTRFGWIVVASTDKGICDLRFVNTDAEGVAVLRQTWPNARLEAAALPLHGRAVSAFARLTDPGAVGSDRLRLHLKGTDFQLAVWRALLQIPDGQVTVYGDVARLVGAPSAARAVGSAIGSNPVAYLIPCHRVIQKAGGLGGYAWGEARKTALLFSETTTG
jgi:AraC family transcriptional regulator, regulatory protein of adaptative response / methylated-DNA-[protein]-cysteine methyltransferase